MKIWKRGIALLLAAALSLSLSACTIPTPGFADYDVSGYIQALLDSSYHDESQALMEISGLGEDQAGQYNDATVENAAVTFCNTYGLAPSEEQLQEFQRIMKQAFALSKYTVKEERKVEGGYYLEVEIASITNFSQREADIEKLREAARQEATAANTVTPLPSSSQEEGQEDGSGEDDFSQPSSQAPVPPQPSGEPVDANSLFVEKVLAFCRQELANVSYDPETRTVALDIRQTDDGELQLDLNQIETIDNTVVRFTK